MTPPPDRDPLALDLEPRPEPEAREAAPTPARPPARRGPALSWPRRLVVAGLLAAVAAVTALSLRPRREPPLPVQLATAQKSAITRKVTAAGKLQAATTVKVSSNISGDLLELPVREGDRVRKGQLLARIEARRYAAQVKQQEALRAGASADLAAERVLIARLEQDLGRVKRLTAGGNASQAEVDRALADLRAEQAKADAAAERIAQADAALADARHLLSFSTVASPIDGIVVTRAKQVGERVRGSDLNEDPIVTIATLSAMEAKVEVGEHEVVYLHEGDPAEVEIDAFPDRKFPAQVIEVAKNALVKNPGTEAEVTTFPVRLALTAAAAGSLPGMSCQATISTETHRDAVVVPIQAVTVRTEKELAGAAQGAPGAAPPAGAPAPAAFARPRREPLRKVVFVVEGGVAKARPVETGLADESAIEIVSGLKEGEQVVEGPYKALSRELKSGKPVKQEQPDGGGR
ncbi:efflux RND transporter periplasmic adaptor subunit [Anaeromyxobacter diazotrophicus]|uniref:RND transporter n=1 Tax=Anaeromyxobacter diazotrophicus TaxID=2590199 RepID=A0A7I9VMX6_9BACT|nr:efflux RND transporter periplasmic adaptor subunit [Anaeromyxobacter diazotrophicus]GEJ57489.1 RND transporter [Anaeromyxobacter diazotrophicus]